MGSEDKFYLDEVTRAAARLGEGFLDSLYHPASRLSPAEGSPAGAVQLQEALYFHTSLDPKFIPALQLIKQRGFGFTYTI